ncbi:MAG: hypothetical protein IJV41_02520 [Oscillospiraceae bacterium]|nr:hypothetical protein [Parasporobacterium sp.]MBQ9685409.1 hypothetical protein [Oscillospiraceae bacterium]
MNIADKMEMEARLIANLASHMEKNGRVISDRSRSNPYTCVRIQRIAWKDRVYEIVWVDGMACRIERQ